jgi:hypothetical protein
MDIITKRYPVRIADQTGGNITEFQPKGGFPPIIICKKNTEQEINELRPREYSTHKNSVSIKDIMKKRRDVVPVVV